MIKKSQFALVFLTICAMLAVWFIKSPVTASTDNDDNEDIVDTNTGRLSGIQDLKDALNNVRNETIASYNDIIASSTSTITEKESANLNIKELHKVQELETIMEVNVINLGFVDCFVHYSTDTVEVLVAAEELSALDAVNIMEVINNSLNDVTVEIIVQYQSVESLK